MSIGLWLWNRVPDATQERDYDLADPASSLDENGRRKGPLRQLLDVLGYGFDGVKSDIDSFQDLIDVDTCPTDFLPHLSALLGFEFPFDLDETSQRAYLHTVLSMYRTKGTAWTLRLAAMRIIGSGFDLVVQNEDHVAKTFDVLVNAETSAQVLPQLEQKLEFMVAQYSPAGMIPSLTVAYYFDEQIDHATVLEISATSTSFASWRMNYRDHKINSNIKTNTFGEQALAF